jgi:hypothetical protein
MKKSKDNYYYHLPSTWTTGTNMNAITKTLKTFLFNIYRAWNNFDNTNQIKINEIIEHLTFVSTAYIGKKISMSQIINSFRFLK